MITLYGIPNCDTIKKARKWLEANNIEHQFHDYRKEGLKTKQLKQWIKELGWETLLNRRGTTWRKLSESEREKVNEKSATALMLEYPAMIKRPLLDTGKTRIVGFRELEYENLLL